MLDSTRLLLLQSTWSFFVLDVGMQGKHRKEKKNGILQKRKLFRLEKKIEILFFG